MNAVRIAILAAAAIAAIAVAFFVRQAMTTSESAVVEVPQAPSIRILAARNDLSIGERVTAADFYWQAWPEESLSPGYIVEGRGQDAADFDGSVVRAAIGAGEPVTGRRLVQPGDAGFMAAVLTPGMRAVAIPISAESGAGGFILPNDRVDVIVTYEEDVEGNRRTSRAFTARTVVENARVLASDQTLGEDAEGEEAVVGETATLELTPNQARAVALAVARGQISLALRSLTDVEGGPLLVTNDEDLPAPTEEAVDEGRVVTLIRYGRVQQVALSSGN